ACAGAAARTRRAFSAVWRPPVASWSGPANTTIRCLTTISTTRSPSWAGPCANRFNKEAAMLDDLKEEGIVNKVGGRFKLSTLIQKRMVMLQQGGRPLVDTRGLDQSNKMAIVLQEILQDRIYLDTENQVQMRGHAAGDVAR